jgi:hypothetical protein
LGLSPQNATDARELRVLAEARPIAVGALVFAESKTDPNVGYALSPTDVAVAVTPFIGRTAPVSSGPCLH